MLIRTVTGAGCWAEHLFFLVFQHHKLIFKVAMCVGLEGEQRPHVVCSGADRTELKLSAFDGSS